MAITKGSQVIAGGDKALATQIVYDDSKTKIGAQNTQDAIEKLAAKPGITYSLSQDATDGHKITLTPSEGTPQTVTIPDNNTWVANTKTTAGYVSAPTAANANKVWKTDGEGNPGWREDGGGGSGGGNFSGVTFYSGDASTATHDANSAIANGHYYYNSNGPGTGSPTQATTNDGALYVQSYSDSWVGQIAQDYRTGKLFVRAKNNGTWVAWNRIPTVPETIIRGGSGGLSYNGGSAGSGQGIAWGTGCNAGNQGVAIGYYATASGSSSATVALGYKPTASGQYAVALANGTASGQYSFAWGVSAKASSTYSYAEGYYTTANNTFAHAEGQGATASGSGAHAEGYYTVASGSSSHAEGQRSQASASYAHAGGQYAFAKGTASFAQGYNVDTSFGSASSSSKNYTNISTTDKRTAADVQGNYLPNTFTLSSATTEDIYINSSTYVTVTAAFSKWSKDYSSVKLRDYPAGSVIPKGTTQIAIVSTSSSSINPWADAGNSNSVSSRLNIYNTGASYAVGMGAAGTGGSSIGYNTVSYNYGELAIGHYNKSNADGGTASNTLGLAFTVGNGTANASRSNAFSVAFDGTVKSTKGTITTGADYAEYFEWLDKNPNQEDRVGKFVTLDGDKIKLATDKDDFILGIVSGQPTIIGNGDCDNWTGMYLRDEFNRLIVEPAPKIIEVEDYDIVEEAIYNEETGETEIIEKEVVVGTHFEEVEDEYNGTHYVLNPKFNPELKYVPRAERPEWAAIGMLGVLSVYQDGTAEVNSYVTVNEEGIAIACDKNNDNAYRVLKIKDNNIIEILFK